MKTPCLFELDEAKEATGTVSPACSPACRALLLTHLPSWLPGETDTKDFGYTPHCETCGKPIEEAAAEPSQAQ